MGKHKMKMNPPMGALKNAIQPKAKVVKKSLCRVSFIVLAVKTFGCVIFYYIGSIGLTFYNQRFIKHFQIPLSLTMAHLVTKFILAGIFRSLLACYNKEERVTLPWGMNIKRIAPTGLASIFDIALSNWSFEFITVSLYTMTKSTAVIFILGFSLLFRLEKPRCSLVFVVLFIAIGLFMFTYHSTQFNLEGFIMVLSASFLSGLRWTLAQMLTQKNELGLHNPLDLMYHVQPWMIIGLLPMSAYFEGELLATKEDFFQYKDVALLARNLGLVFAGALLAFFLEFSEFLLVASTSSLTLSIAGIFKEVCIMYLAATINNDKMNPLNVIGLVVCLFGISLHVVLKAVNRNSSATENGRISEEAMEMLKQDGGANVDDASDNEDEEDIFNVQRDR